MNDLNSHYKQYYKKYGKNAYTMQQAKDTSRVRYISKYLREYVREARDVLDLGCGDTYLGTTLPQYRWTGLDLNVERAKGNIIEHDLMKPPYPFNDQYFQAVVCSEVLEHVWDLRVVHHEIARVIKHGGIYIVSTPNFDWLYYQMTNYRKILFDPSYSHQFEHIRQYNIDVHTQFLKEAGFDVLKYMGCDAHFNPMFAGLRKNVADWINNDLHPSKPVTVFDVDMVLGKSFPTTSHTILLVARKMR